MITISCLTQRSFGMPLAMHLLWYSNQCPADFLLHGQLFLPPLEKKKDMCLCQTFIAIVLCCLYISRDNQGNIGEAVYLCFFNKLIF